MRKLVVAALFLLLIVPAAPHAHAQAYNARPRLVVLLVIDQFRGDYLDRYRDSFTTANGFNLFLKKGAYFNGCYFDYANTKTAPGHATIGTGAYTDGHGIGSNDWWDLGRNTDRVISSVEDERYRIVANFDDLPVLPGTVILPTAARIGASPLNLRATTIGDEVRLATGGQARLYGISLKDRAAILPSGQTANAAYWIDQATGRWITSTYYMAQLPEWVTAFNKGPRVAQAVKEAGLDDTTQFYALVGRTPAANSYELDFARSLIENERLGQGTVTDVLTISLSANDILGHQMGPDSDDQRQMVLGLDRDIDSFFTWLDQKIGLANVTVAFTADHGIAPIPSVSAKLGVASARIDLDDFANSIETTLNRRFTAPFGKKRFLLPTQELPYIELDPRAFGNMTEKDAEQAVVDAIPAAIRSLGPPATPPNNNSIVEGNRKYSESRVDASPALAFVRSRVDLADGKIPATEFGRLIAHSYTANGGWYVMVFPTAYQMEYSSGSQTTHFSPWSYDRHVPLGFYGAAFEPGYYREQVAPVDIAATLASLLGVNQPSASVGHVLTFALRPTIVAPAR
ncbi:MAG: alkaline phosphatase family protein [Acidobacteriaceae bacterium]|jgi:predicted AlkP superfamily pyrophosphatase or phosphodiesterase